MLLHDRDCHSIQEICERGFEREPSVLEFVSSWYKIQKMSEGAIANSSYFLLTISGYYKSQEMCGKGVTLSVLIEIYF